MNEFLLVAGRRQPSAELSPAGTGQSVAVLAHWRGLLHRWGLLRSFGVPAEEAGQPCACLVVRASGEVVAARLARHWSQLSGCDVAVLPLIGAGRFPGAA